MRHFASRIFSGNVTPQVQRERFERINFSLWRALKVSSQTIDVEGVCSELLVAEDSSDERIVLYLHGGAYTFGSASSYKDLTSGIAHFGKIKVLVPNYRLAPECPYPAALDDSLCAYRWLLKQGYKSENIVITGDSAGAGLALATLLKLRDEAAPLPAACVCLSPWVDLCCEGDSYTSHEKLDPLFTSQWLRDMAKLYVQDEATRNPYISPLYADDFKGLPSVMIQVGSDEVFLDDAITLNKRLREDGLEVNFKVYQDMWHVWQSFAAIIPEGKEAIVEIGEFVNAKITEASLSSMAV